MRDRRERDNSASGGIGPGNYMSRESSTSGTARTKLSRARSTALDLRKPISKVAQPSFTAAAAAWGSGLVRSSSVVQTFVRDTEWLGSQAAGLWDKVVDTCTGASWNMENASSQGTTGNNGPNPFAGPSFSNWGGTADVSMFQRHPSLIRPTHVAGQQLTSGNNPADTDNVVPEPQPEFLPMVPWYSGTSADLLKTCLDLMVSVKLFLGRFDMRTMQV